jgi:ABC-2 type transport system permease protein
METMMVYLRVFGTFARNSLVRDMTFRSNTFIDAISSTCWAGLRLAFYDLIYRYTPSIGENTGWERSQFMIFFATGQLINGLVMAFFMSNADEFTELIRTGNLDFLLLKPIDTQFLVSFKRVDWSSFSGIFLGLGLLVYGLCSLHYTPPLLAIGLYLFYVICGILIYYSLMIALCSMTVWMGRNLTLYDFWFYITNFSNYPMEIYKGTLGTPLRQVCTWVLPILVVVNVPTRLLIRPLLPNSGEDWLLSFYTLAATLVCLVFSRRIFLRALGSYRSASS